jgi:hypothetical protein
MTQKKKYEGHRRLNTPQNRLKRTVAFRYSQRVRTVKNTANQKETGKHVEEIKVRIPFEKTADQTTYVYKPSRKEKKNQWVEAMVEQPNASYWKTLFHPLKTMNAASDNEYLSMGPFKAFLWNAFAWLCYGASMAHLYMADIDKQQFSFARFNFTDCCWLAIRIMLFGLAVTYGAYACIKFVGRLTRKPVYQLKIMEIDALASAPVSMLFLICFGLMLKAGGFGIVLFVICFGAAVALRMYGLRQSTGFSWRAITIFTVCYAAVCIMLYLVYYEIAMRDLIRIFSLI